MIRTSHKPVWLALVLFQFLIAASTYCGTDPDEIEARSFQNSDSQTVFSMEDEPEFPADHAIMELLPKLDIQTKKHLLYLYSKLERPKMAEKLARNILLEQPGDHETLIALASIYLKVKDSLRLLKTAQAILKNHPRDPDGLYFLASVYELVGRYIEAEAILKDLKRNHFKRTEFPFQMELAIAAGRTGNWGEAMRAYQAILSGHRMESKIQQEARMALDEIYRNHLPQSEIRWHGIKLTSGTIMRSSANYDFQMTKTSRLYLRTDRDDLYQQGAKSQKEISAERMGGLVSMETVFDRDWFAKLGMGGYSKNPVAMGQLKHIFESQREISLMIDYNERATDSLPLEILDGRQNQVKTTFGIPITSTTTLGGYGAARQVHIEDELLGEGFNFELNIHQIALRHPIEVDFGYQGALQAFTQKSGNTNLVRRFLESDPTEESVDLLDNLIAPDVNRHEISLTLRGKITQTLNYELHASTGYSFDQELHDYGYSAGLVCFPNKSLELSLQGGYLSSGGQSNQGAEVKEVTITLKVYF